jgi:hypothetical protein
MLEVREAVGEQELLLQTMREHVTYGPPRCKLTGMLRVQAGFISTSDSGAAAEC